jgi:hypothetical protein
MFGPIGFGDLLALLVARRCCPDARHLHALGLWCRVGRSRMRDVMLPDALVRQPASPVADSFESKPDNGPDSNRGIMLLDAELHADQGGLLLLAEGSRRSDL